MNLKKWLHLQSKKENEFISLYDALSSMSLNKYFNYRLRYLYLRSFLATVIHVVEFVVLFFFFSVFVAGFIFLFRTTLLIFDSFWWGALEHLREKVRDYYYEKDFNNIRNILSFYLKSSIVISLLITLITTAYIMYDYSRVGFFTLIQLYIISIAFYYVSDIIYRVYHSTVFAISRVYRTLSSIVLVQIVAFSLIVSLYPVIGWWCIPVGLILATIIKLLVGFSFTKRRYDSLKLPKVSFKYFLRASHKVDLKTFFYAGFASLLQRADLFLIFFLLLLDASSPQTIYPAYLTYLIGPLLRFNLSFPNLFYFDFTKLRRQRSYIVALNMFFFLSKYMWFFMPLLIIISFGLIFFLISYIDALVIFSLLYFLVACAYWGLFHTFLFSFKRYDLNIILSSIGLILWGALYSLFGYVVSTFLISTYMILCFIFLEDIKPILDLKDDFKTKLELLNPEKKLSYWLIKFNNKKPSSIKNMLKDLTESYVGVHTIKKTDFILITKNKTKEDVIIDFAASFDSIKKLSKANLKKLLVEKTSSLSSKNFNNLVSTKKIIITKKHRLSKRFINWVKEYPFNHEPFKKNEYYLLGYCPDGFIEKLVLVKSDLKIEEVNRIKNYLKVAKL